MTPDPDAALEARLRAPGALANAAQWYCQHAIPIFPLQPGGKTPATAHGFHDATTDPDVIAHWWERTPQANIGIPTGVVFDVIDVDGPEGFRSLAHLGGYPDGMIARVVTPRGTHLYTQPNPDRRNGTAIMPGIDVRGTGGYVVAPPSRLDDGRAYRWSVDHPPRFIVARAAV